MSTGMEKSSVGSDNGNVDQVCPERVPGSMGGSKGHRDGTCRLDTAPAPVLRIDSTQLPRYTLEAMLWPLLDDWGAVNSEGGIHDIIHT